VGAALQYRRKKMGKLDRPTVPEVIGIVRDYYAKPGNIVGGSLHLVLEDGNIDDESVRFCLQWAIDKDDQDGIRLAGMLLTMTKTQRKKLYRLQHY
jgi:hypothetical protein